MAGPIQSDDFGFGADSSAAATGGVGADDNSPETPNEPSRADIEAQVKDRFKHYTQARTFDKGARKQFAKDRRYAAGKSDIRWAVDTNLVGAFIDILCATLYARNPDVSIRKAPQVDDEGTQQMEDFAKTSELVVSRLWLMGKLKKQMRRTIRSVLSVGQGWLKLVFITDKIPRPELNAELSDLQSKLANLTAAREQAADPDSPMSDDEMAVEQGRIQALIDDIRKRLERNVCTGLKIDFVRSEDMQVSLDVATIEDYEEAGWCANAIYILKDTARARFPQLSDDDLKEAREYYQKMQSDHDKDTTPDLITPLGDITADAAEMFTTSNQAEDTPKFVKVVEQWDRTDGNVYTMIEGVKVWAKDPFVPEYASSRFFPYFYFAFFEVDDLRHPQSLSWRLHKLQDEYACSRSNFRLTRERSIPGIVVNATQMSDVEVQKLSVAKMQEIIPIKLTDPAQPFSNVFAAKPIGQYDPRIYDNQPILGDMERVSGVQEALQAATQVPKTATEASIQQTGFMARTGADRDSMETTMVDMAQYTLEQALQCMEIAEVQRICGSKAFWPAHMDIADLLTMVQVSIFAGTTGKPKSEADRQAWSVVLPLLRELLVQIQAASGSGNTPLAKALTELLKETFTRMGDDIDVDRFIPQGLGDPQPPPKNPPPEVKITLTGALPPNQEAQIAQIAIAELTPPPPPPVTPGGGAAGSPGAPGPMPPAGGLPALASPPGGSPAAPSGAAPPSGP